MCRQHLGTIRQLVEFRHAQLGEVRELVEAMGAQCLRVPVRLATVASIQELPTVKQLAYLAFAAERAHTRRCLRQIHRARGCARGCALPPPRIRLRRGLQNRLGGLQ